MDNKVSALDDIPAVDRAADYLYIVDTDASTSNKVTPNTLLGITGTPVGTSDTQTLTNKTLTSPTITTPTLTVNDSSLTIQDNSDTTKKLQFQLSGITTGTTRTITVPDADTTLVGTGTTQTLTNKTLTSPTITNPTLTVDTISEFTSANGVNIDGLLIKDGALPAGSITPANLTSGTGSSWAWQSWTPTLTNISGGTLNYSKYIQIGKMVFVKFKYTLAGAGMGSAPTMTLPITAAADTASSETGETFPGTVSLINSATNYYQGSVMQRSTTVVGFRTDTSELLPVNATLPFTWGTNDYIMATFFYEAA